MADVVQEQQAPNEADLSAQLEHFAHFEQIWLSKRYVKAAPNNHLCDLDGQPQPDALPLQELTFEQRALCNLNLEPDFNQEQLQYAYEEQMKYLTGMCAWLKNAQQFNADAPIPKRERAVAMLDMAYHGYLTLFASFRGRCLVEGRGDNLSDPPEHLLSLRFSTYYKFTDKKATAYQELILFLLDRIFVLGYRRFNDACYRQICTKPEGYGTHAWERVMSIEDFVFSAIRKEDHFDMWLNLTANPSNGARAVDFLKVTVDMQFPTLRKNRQVFSFSNGVYIANKETFLPYWTEQDSGQPCAVRDLESDVVASHYFDTEFVDWKQRTNNWYDIPTPHFQQILDYQELHRDVCIWMYILIGRLLYSLNEVDCWQVIPFIKGTAGSGKSTILKLCKSFYEANDVGVLSNNVEKQFGLSQFYDKFLFIAPEIKRDFNLDQAEFQSVVSGEDMVVAQKFKKPISLVWNVPGILAGNEVPDWVDNSGSISRRVVVFHFAKKVTQSNPHLGKRLREEIGYLICKCNLAYVASVYSFGQDDCWKHMPDYFKETQRQMSQSCNALQAFLNSDQIILADNYYCPQSEFLKKLGEFAKANAYPLPRWEMDFYRSIFDQHNLKIQMDEFTWPRGSGPFKKCNYIVGADLTSSIPSPQAQDTFPIANPLNQP